MPPNHPLLFPFVVWKAIYSGSDTDRTGDRGFVFLLPQADPIQAIQMKQKRINAEIEEPWSCRLEGNLLRVRHRQDWDRGFVLLLAQATVLPGSGAVCDVVKPL